MSTIRIARFAAFLAVALALVITGGVAGVAGQALILGQSNSAGGSQTHLTANLSAATLKVSQFGSGSPLSLKGSTNKPPMVVNSNEKVENLNADRVDGKNAGQFLPSAWYRQSDSVTIAAGGFAALTVVCDAGDHLLSGGHRDKNSSTNALDSYPSDTGAGWSFSFQNQGAGSDTILTFAMCADFAPHHSAVTSADEPPRD